MKEVNIIMLGTMEEVNEVVVKESTAKNIIEKQAQHKPLSQLPDAIQISEGECF